MIDGQINGNDIKEFLKTVTLPFGDSSAAMQYHDVHSQRYAITLKCLAKLDLNNQTKVLELAANPYGMSAYLCSIFGNTLTLGTYADTPNQRSVSIGVDGNVHNLREFGFNVEQDLWPFEEESFDLVIACEIIEHLAMDPMALVAGANRILKPGGLLFISTPNQASIQNFLKLARLMPAGLAQQFRRPLSLARIYERHNREYSPFTIGEMCVAGGFEIVLMETDSAFPVTPLGFSQEHIDEIINMVGIPELRCDTVNVVGRKVGGVVDRYPTSHDLYVAEDN